MYNVKDYYLGATNLLPVPMPVLPVYLIIFAEDNRRVSLDILEGPLMC